jgi:L-amino acid N-acyltransferase YncA
VEIRDALNSDLPGLLGIYNEVIATSTAIFTDHPVTLEDRRAWWQARVALGYPVLVALDAAEVVGFATFGDFRSWPGYCHTIEHSVHVRADQRGRGVGHQLVEALFPLANALGKHVMIAGVDADNAGSIRFHEHLGFEQVGRMRQVGCKFGRWLDLVFLQRYLDAAAVPLPPRPAAP